MNYLQIPAGTEHVYYDFDMADFVDKFKLDANLGVYALKALEQEELFSFNEQVFAAATIFFVTNKDGLYDFEINNPALEPLIKVLLRTYSGILDQPVHVHEKVIANLLGMDLETLTTQLKMLHSRGIIEYIPQKDGPQLYISRSRVRAEDLQIKEAAYKKRKEQYEKRVQAIIRYSASTDCRSQYIAKYFGEDGAKPCGICDNCLKKKKSPLSKEEFETIHQRVLHVLDNEKIQATKLFHRFGEIQKEKLNQVIDFLQAENKLHVDKDGFVRRSG